MINLWMSTLNENLHQAEDAARAKAANAVELSGVRNELRDIKHHLQKMALVNQALWELVRNKLNLAEEDLAALVREIDLRDGVEDGAITHGPLRCPQCGRISNSRHYKCLYCGLQFEKPTTG